MIVNTSTHWATIPTTTPQEAAIKKATITFYAHASHKEKVLRLFNGTLFIGTVARALVPLLPSSFVGHLSSLMHPLKRHVFSFIGSSISSQAPLINTCIMRSIPIISTVALILVVRKVLAVVVCHFVYPAVILSYCNNANKARQSAFTDLKNANYQGHRICLNKSGIDYDAFAFSNNDNARPWVLVAGGNGWIGEGCISSTVREFDKRGFNTLFVNGPGVAQSTGFPTSYSIGAGQEAGLQFLEEVIQAKKILLYGTSLGGGAQAEAILNHSFKSHVSYMVWSDRTFDLLSNAASGMVTRLAKPLFFLLGIELNGVAAAKRLSELKINHIVTQNIYNTLPSSISFENEIQPKGSDRIIPNSASLAYGLFAQKLHTNPLLKIFGNCQVYHNGDLPLTVKQSVENELKLFCSHNT